MPATTILSRVAPESRHKLMTPLAADDAAALRTTFTAGLMRPALPPEQAQRLIDAGYMQQGTGGTFLTDTGAVRAQMELGQ